MQVDLCADSPSARRYAEPSSIESDRSKHQGAFSHSRATRNGHAADNKKTGAPCPWARQRRVRGLLRRGVPEPLEDALGLSEAVSSKQQLLEELSVIERIVRGLHSVAKAMEDAPIEKWWVALEAAENSYLDTLINVPKAHQTPRPMVSLA
jgi:hypothetical protein